MKRPLLPHSVRVSARGSAANSEKLHRHPGGYSSTNDARFAGIATARGDISTMVQSNHNQGEIRDGRRELA